MIAADPAPPTPPPRAGEVPDLPPAAAQVRSHRPACAGDRSLGSAIPVRSPPVRRGPLTRR
jgi:hypothetical protein